MIILLFLIILGNCNSEPHIIQGIFRPKNKLQKTPTPEPECEELIIDDENPNEFSMSAGTLYRVNPMDWYLKATDKGSQQTVLINLNDITKVNFVQPEDKKEEAEDEPLQQFREFVWTPMEYFGYLPKNRGGHSMHNIGNYVLVFGGCFLDYKCFNEIYLFDVQTRKWNEIRAFGIPPIGRTAFGSFVNGGKFFVFGGQSLQGLLNDLHMFDLENRSWTQLFLPGFVPTPRAGHKMVLTSWGGLVFGGYVGDKYTNEIYIFNIEQWRWDKPIATGDLPLPREAFGMVSHHGTVYVLGGYGVGVVLDDLYTLNDELVWEKKEMFGSKPSAREGISMAEFDHRIYLVGGCNPKIGECYYDLLALDTNTLHVSSVSAFDKKNLKPVEYAGLVYQQGLLIHFGGCTLMKTCSDTLLAINLNNKCPPCRNGGVCRGGYCNCPVGFQGIDCTVNVLCKMNCLGQGQCMNNGDCRCFSGYMGEVCQYVIPCPRNCTDAEHGECQHSGKCKCKEGFSGDTCGEKEEEEKKEEECLNNCSGHGDCDKVHLICQCEEGYSGPDCSIEDAKPDEQFKSVWETLKDDPDTPEKGTTVIRMSHFLANAYKSGTSNSDDPFELMPLTECPDRCSRHGVCIENSCYCWYGYTGESCQASNMVDFYIGVRKQRAAIAIGLSIFFGLVTGLIIVQCLRKRSVDDEFRNVSSLHSDLVDE